MAGSMCSYILLCSILCGFASATVHLHFGSITSPNYPRPYPDNNQTTWTITAPEGFLIKLTFQDFDLEPSEDCHYDFVEVFSQKMSLGKFCGQKNTAVGNYPHKYPIISKAKNMTVVFQSDFSNEYEYKGFFAHYESIDLDECSQSNVVEEGMGDFIQKASVCDHYCHNYLGGYFCSCRAGFKLMSDKKSCKVDCSNEIYTKSSGVITSPDYPRPYPADLNCTYRIVLQEGQGIIIDFEDMDIDSHPEVDCPYDTLKLTANDKDLGTFCGSNHSGMIETFSNIVNINFITDESGDSKGWKIRYSSDKVRCPNPVPKDMYTIISPIQDEYRFLDYIIVNCKTGYKIMDNNRERKYFTSSCTSRGTWQLELPSCKIIDCGSPLKLLNGYFERKKTTGDNTYESIIEYSCNKHYEMVTHSDNKGLFTCKANRKWQDKNNSSKIPDCIPICGKPVNPVEKHQRVLSGMAAPAQSFPWQTLIINKGRSGGALLNDEWIITAAHVIHPKGLNPKQNMSDVLLDLEIYMGGNDINEFNFTRYIEAEDIFVHPNFNEEEHDFDSDIALIKMKKKVTLNDDLLPICLPSLDDNDIYESDRLGYVSGWGVTEKQILSNKLKYIGLPIVNQKTCKTSYQGKKIKEHDPIFNENMFCAGYREGGKDSCQGDSGGAFTIQKNGTWIVAGIISWGIGCGKPGHYGSYVKVSQYLDWINDVIEQN
ncbi:complement C1r subcomponent-like [Protopterus annectens]|uniref:complement C1r subcomponent-like n=1 Tax=Protopterus annectens TaxID=7888 RepID=UPI001CF930EF|nr:complement C1r subcomponent-like [Protopterus annectens]